MRYGAGQESAAATAPLSDDVPDLAAGGELGALPGASPALAAPQRGYCVSSRCCRGRWWNCTIFASVHTEAQVAWVDSRAVRLGAQQIVPVCVFHADVWHCKRLSIGLQSGRSS